jgi:hypothetical protein
MVIPLVAGLPLRVGERLLRPQRIIDDDMSAPRPVSTPPVALGLADGQGCSAALHPCPKGKRRPKFIDIDGQHTRDRAGLHQSCLFKRRLTGTRRLRRCAISSRSGRPARPSLLAVSITIPSVAPFSETGYSRRVKGDMASAKAELQAIKYICGTTCEAYEHLAVAIADPADL